MTSKQKIRIFILAWFGQEISMFGTHLTNFGLGVSLYLDSKSVMVYSLILFATLVPELVLSPIAGVLVDRWERRMAMLIGNGGAGVCSLIILYLSQKGTLSFPVVLILVGISSAFNSLNYAALGAVTSLLIPKEHLARANGMVQMGFAFVQLSAPALAGFLLMKISMTGILAIDVVTFMSTLIILILFVKFPKPKKSKDGSSSKGTVMEEMKFGWAYIRKRPGLIGLLVVIAFTNFHFGIVETLFGPLILSYASSAVFGLITSTGGVGMLCGSLLMLAWGGPKRKITAMLIAIALQATNFFLIVCEYNTYLVAFAVFCATFFWPIIGSCDSAIWQRKVPQDIQGRVFSFRTFIGGGSIPLAFLLAGPMVDYLFAPLMATDGALAPVLGPIIGSGEGKGIVLFFILLGIGSITVACLAYLYSPIRNVETDLPDIAIDSTQENVD
jgi:MFS transporter, DHA3 family, macrolide efflux protein